MAGRYKLGNHPLVRLGLTPTWAEDPLRDVNWRERFHMLRFVMALMIEWQESGERRYRDRALALVQSWIARNPRSSPASHYSWGDHATAWRAMTLVCIARMLPRKRWLVRAIATHGAVLADPASMSAGATTRSTRRSDSSTPAVTWAGTTGNGSRPGGSEGWWRQHRHPGRIERAGHPV